MTSGAHIIDGNANLKAQIDSEGPGLSFGYFEILLACIVIEIIASFWENSFLFGKFDLFWPHVTSILTSSKNDPYVFCSTLHGLSNAVYRFSMRCVVLEISGGGWNQPPPPAGSRLAQTPAGARVKIRKIVKIPYYMLDDNDRWICVQNFKSISSKIAELRYKTCKKQALFTSFRDFTVIFRFFYWFWRFKKEF